MLSDQNQKPIVLEVEGLRVYYETPAGDVLAVNGIDFQLYQGETLGLVGESGCGKSTAAMGILQLVVPPGRIVSGQVLLDGQNLLDLSARELRKLRWAKLVKIPTFLPESSRIYTTPCSLAVLPSGAVRTRNHLEFYSFWAPRFPKWPP